MLKLFAAILGFLLIGLAVLGLQHHKLEITSQSVKLHNDIVQRQHTLWDQQVLISQKTNPLALAEGLKKAGMSPGEALTPREKPKPVNRVEGDLIAPLRR